MVVDLLLLSFFGFMQGSRSTRSSRSSLQGFLRIAGEVFCLVLRLTPQRTYRAKTSGHVYNIGPESKMRDTKLNCCNCKIQLPQPLCTCCWKGSLRRAHHFQFKVLIFGSNCKTNSKALKTLHLISGDTHNLQCIIWR